MPNLKDKNWQRTITVISKHGNSIYMNLTEYFSEKTQQKKPMGGGV
jgi:hypothetical protein